MGKITLPAFKNSRKRHYYPETTNSFMKQYCCAEITVILDKTSIYPLQRDIVNSAEITVILDKMPIVKNLACKKNKRYHGCKILCYKNLLRAWQFIIKVRN